MTLEPKEDLRRKYLESARQLLPDHLVHKRLDAFATAWVSGKPEMVSFRRYMVTSTIISPTTLSGMLAAESYWKDVVFEGCDFEGVELDEATFDSCTFVHCRNVPAKGFTERVTFLGENKYLDKPNK